MTRLQDTLIWLGFALTLLPLGYGYTFYGSAGLVVVLVVIALTLCIAWPLFRISESFVDTPIYRRFYKKAHRLIFATPEKKFLAIISFCFLLLALALKFYNFGGLTDAQDAAAQLIHARIIASGHWTLPALAHEKFFHIGVMVNDTRYYSQFPPGHIMLLALGEFFHVAFLVNPLLGLCTLWTIYALAKDLYGEPVARVSALLAFASPWFVLMSAEYSNHSTSLLFASLFLLYFMRTQRPPHYKSALIAGFALGYVIITRPLTGIAIGLPFTIYALFKLSKNFSMYIRYFGLMLLGSLPPLLFLLYFNLQTTGDPWVMGYMKLPLSPLGFKPLSPTMAHMMGNTSHSLAIGIGQLFNSVNSLHYYLFCWPTSSLLLVALGFYLPVRGPEKLLWAMAGSLLFCYIFYYYQDWDYGPRFVYEACGILLIATARALYFLPAIISQLTKRDIPAQAIRIRAASLVMLASLFGWGIGAHILPGHSWWPTNQHDAARLETKINGPSLIFVTNNDDHFFLPANYYPIKSDNPIIIATDLGEGQDLELMRAYPQHKAYRWYNIGQSNEVFTEIIR